MPRQATPLTDTKIKSLKPKATRYRTSDTGGLLIEVMPSGAKIWRYRYQLFGVRQPPLTIGNYPDVSLAAARKQRDEWASLVAHGASPKEAVLANKTAHLNTVPDGHPKLLHCWPVKLLQAGRGDYAGSEVMIRRAAASLSL